MHRIQQGVLKYREGVHQRHLSLFERLSRGQQPEVLFITCSDSRIDPALITQTDPGDLFVVRNAGNIVPPVGRSAGGEAATIEYAIKALGVPHVVVCGHVRCGAMDALRNPEPPEHLPSVCEWLAIARPALEREGGFDRQNDTLQSLIERNVRQQLDNLRSYGFIRDAEARGALTLDGWIYDFEHGEVLEMDRESGRFGPLAPVATVSAHRSRARAS